MIWQVRYDGAPEVMAEYACLARDAGARIIGGCCGTTASHLAAMREALERRPRAAAPDHAAIEARLGPLTVTLETREAVARAKEDGARARAPAASPSPEDPTAAFDLPRADLITYKAQQMVSFSPSFPVILAKAGRKRESRGL